MRSVNKLPSLMIVAVKCLFLIISAIYWALVIYIYTLRKYSLSIQKPFRFVNIFILGLTLLQAGGSNKEKNVGGKCINSQFLLKWSSEPRPPLKKCYSDDFSQERSFKITLSNEVRGKQQPTKKQP